MSSVSMPTVMAFMFCRLPFLAYRFICYRRLLVVATYALFFLIAHVGSSMALANPPMTGNANLEVLVQTQLGIFVVKPNLRDESSYIRAVKGQLRIAFRKSVSRRERKKILCLGARWLLTGRLEETPGAASVFRRRPELTSIRLTFFDVKTSVEPNRDRGYRQKRKIIEQARFIINKDRAQRLDRAVLRRNLQGDTCTRIARKVLNEVWVKGD